MNCTICDGKWNKLSEVPPPVGKEILAIWVDGDRIDAIDWYLIDKSECWWNLNSNNLNIFGEEGHMDFPDYWMYMLRCPTAFEE